MTYEQFNMLLKERVSVLLKPHKVLPFKDGLLIRFPDEGFCKICTEEMYKVFLLHNETIDYLAQTVAKCFTKSLYCEYKYEELKNRIIPIINFEKVNRDGRVFTTYLDLQITYRYPLISQSTKDVEEIVYTEVTEYLLNQWGINLDKLKENAFQNIERQESILMPVPEMLANKTGIPGFFLSMYDDEIAFSNILKEKMLRQIGDVFKTDYFIYAVEDGWKGYIIVPTYPMPAGVSELVERGKHIYLYSQTEKRVSIC